MSNKIYVVKRRDEIYGVLPDKATKKVFESQRDMSLYEIAKIPEKIVMERLEYYDLGRYMSITIYDYVLFPHEEMGMIEHFEAELDNAVDEIQMTNNLFSTYVKFDEEEEKLFHLFNVLMTYTYMEERNNGIFLSENRKGIINMPYLIKTWIGMIDDGFLEDAYFE